MSQSTRDRLLEAAKTVFAEHGFEGATVQMIATAAGANIAAINYHYGSKAELYAKYVVGHLEASMGRMPRLSDDPGDPEGQLRRLVAWFFERFRPDSPLRRLNQDMSAMKGDFAETILETVIKPEFENCSEFVRALLPAKAPEEKVRNWVKSIISLCTGPLHSAHLYPLLFPGAPFDASEVSRQAEHVAQAILDGLAADARRLG
ncbi:TetR/AcrR family transcriptional regulator [Pelagicoccus sp. SDUM812005]|uniref:TetR/AcrR family transcriptional regulator n=1 Tax=Pelagicoccus sp. SDUM812005 TaxID=3041257 RepID=UPI00280DDF5A|nr:TetR/AcrR family transcriptional regulator [Pelagicoccus sp. SDUM812005]MDQ8183532.1 TetR/AcrR family transcriptional regulator [Pelagicoccus sp. SDUM812005]